MTFEKLIWKEPWLGPVALNLTVIESREIPTAAVTPDGRTFYYNPDFWKKLKPAERLGVQIHELLHIVNRHAERRQHREPNGGNIACDMAVNALILDAGYVLPADALPGENDTAELIYDRLRMVEIPVKGMKKNNSPYLGQSPERGGTAPILADDLLEQNADGTRGFQDLETRQIMESAGRLAGQGTSPLAKSFRPGASAVDWRTVLQNLVCSAVGSDMDYLDYEFDESGVCEDVLMPKPRPKICVLADESGSIEDSLYEQFLGELRKIGKTAEVNVSGFTDHTEFTPVPLRKYHRSMTGGTDVRRTYEQACRKQYDCIIILTDGFLEFPTREPCPTIWVMPEHHNRKWEVIL